MAATLDELLAQYSAKQAEASSLAQDAGSLSSTLLAAGGGATGLIGAITAPIAARYIGDAFGLNKRSAAEEQALGRIRDVAEGGRTAAQTALEYQRARTARMSAQAASQGPARERTARQLIGQEQNISAQQDITAQAAQVKAQEQARAQQALADSETRAGESERQRQRQMVAGSVTGGLGALAQAYGGYAAGKQRAADLASQAKGTQAAIGTIIDTIKAAQSRTTPSSVAQEMAAPMTEAAKAQQAQQAGEAPQTASPVGIGPMTPNQFELSIGGPSAQRYGTSKIAPELTMGAIPGAADAMLGTGPYALRKQKLKKGSI
jgi:hypothetical protein